MATTTFRTLLEDAIGDLLADEKYVVEGEVPEWMVQDRVNWLVEHLADMAMTGYVND